SSEVVRRLAEEGYFRVIVLTDRESDSGVMPAYCRVIRFGEVPGWADTPVRRAQFFKWAAPFLFPRIRVRLYVDSNFNFTGRVGMMSRLLYDITTHGSLVTRHEARRGWEDEYRQILRCGRTRNRRLLELQQDYYALEGLSGEIPL